MESNSYSASVAIADLQIDIAHRRVKRTWISVDRRRERDCTHERLRYTAHASRTLWAGALPLRRDPAARKDDHVCGTLTGVCGRVRSEQDYRTLCTEADDADAGPHENCVRDAITARRYEEDSFAMLVGDCIDRLLQGVGIVRRAVTFYTEARIVQVDCSFITEALGVEGGRALARGMCGARSNYQDRDDAIKARL